MILIETPEVIARSSKRDSPEYTNINSVFPEIFTRGENRIKLGHSEFLNCSTLMQFGCAILAREETTNRNFLHKKCPRKEDQAGQTTNYNIIFYNEQSLAFTLQSS